MSGRWDKLRSQLVDTHCHPTHYDSPEALIEAVAESGMTVHAMSLDPVEYEQIRDRFADQPHILPALGLYPDQLEARAPQIDRFLDLLPGTRLVGEVGLDFVTEDLAERATQRDLFGQILDACDDLGDRVLSIHSRRSADDVVAMIGDRFHHGAAILHWFSGSSEALERAIEAGCWFSLNTAMTRSDRSRKLIRMMPRDRVLTETDGPYIQHGGRPAQPSDLKVVVESLAVMWGVSIEEALGQVSNNYQRLMGG